MTNESEAVQPPKKGRPAGKRGTFSFRVTPSLRAKLENAAGASQRPVSEEIEIRLEKSFSDIDTASSLFGGPETLMLARAISMLAYAVDTKTSSKWTENLEAKGHLDWAISRFMKIYFHEQGAPPHPGALSLLGEAEIGYSSAELVAEMLGLRSAAREEMAAFLETDEGKAAMERVRSKAAKSDA